MTHTATITVPRSSRPVPYPLTLRHAAAQLRPWAVRCLCAFASALTVTAGAAALTPDEEAGRRIYNEGVSASGATVTAQLAGGTFEVPGSAVPCANCHGTDGLGRPEGGVVPPNIQWSELTKPYGHTHFGGRRHPAFSERTVQKAFLFGADPAGNDLDPAMPRYRMSDADAASLVAYLKRIEFMLPPGVSARAIRIGTVLPATGHFAETGRALRRLLEGWIARINDSGGLYGRKLELVIADYGDSPQTAYVNAWKLATEGDVFLLLSPFSAGWESRLDRMARDEHIPVVAPVTLLPEDSRSSNLYVFHLLSGIAELGQVLAAHVARIPGLPDAPLLIVHGDGGADLARGVAERLGELGFGKVLPPQSFIPGAADVASLARIVAEGRVGTLLVLGPGLDVATLARATSALGAHPHLLVPGPYAPPDILDLPPAFRDRVFLSYPTVPADQRPAALDDCATLMGGSPSVRPPHLAQAYAAALATVNALKEVGRDLSREKFTRALETLSGFDSGMLPPLSFNSDRRIGSLGGYVVAADPVDKSLRPAGAFQQLTSTDTAAAAPAAGKETPK